MAYSKLPEITTVVGNTIEKHYQCPFVPSHTCRKDRFGNHLRKCQRGISQTKNPFDLKAMMMEQCPYNILHYIMYDEIEDHKKICADRPISPLVSPKSAKKPSRPKPKIPSQEETFGSKREMWDDEKPVYVDATAKVDKDSSLVYLPQGKLTKNQRKKFRQKRRLQKKDPTR